ncbi:MarR family winged helix-turn-helix transcriptional regulator [Actinomadura sp. 21ATH]|uniref:MarR family winged helix-turn-helix transcriptional regulator n=1 Tax=Actinomadura sp. 21ATH TaxID=1735444 RepID=UPI0035C07273
MDEPGDPGALEPLEMRAWVAFLEASHLVEHEIQRQLKRDGGLSHADFDVLINLRVADAGRMRMSDLARKVMISKSRLTYQITQLERAGLVRRTACATDRRAVWAELTEAGAETLARVRPGHRRVVRENLIDVLTPGELRTLGETLGRVADRLRGR